MKSLTTLLLLVLLSISFGKTTSLPRSTPESKGIASASIQAFVEAADKEIQQSTILYSS